MIGKTFTGVVSLIGLGALGFAQAPSDIDKKRARREAQKIEQEAERLDLEAAHAEDKGRVFGTLSKELGVPVETLKAQQQHTNFGFGRLFVANAFAKATGKTFDQMARELKNGRGWGVIAPNTNLGRVINEMRHSRDEMRRAHEEEMARRREEGRGEQRKTCIPDETSRSAAAGEQGSRLRKSRRRGQ